MDSIKNIIKESSLPRKQVCSKVCEIHGEYESTVTERSSLVKGKPTRMHYSLCPKCLDDHEQKQKETQDRKREDKVRFEIKNTNVPKRYQGFDIHHVDPKNEKQGAIIKRCQKFTKDFSKIKALGASIIFTGKPGTGKTMIALSMVPGIIKAMYDGVDDVYHNGYSSNSCIYSNVYDIFTRVKSTYRKNSEDSESNIIAQYSTAGLLIIDEIGVQSGTDFESNIIFRIINRRYEEMKPTFIISNLSMSDLEGYIGQRTVDRFRENHGAVFVFDWESHRK